ncbi:MAG TPA: glycosyltransferase family 2 protein [Chloroflexota bacterium]|nr:glycosyltransferase family 2 protein [Chloroflexota bacterium]
MLMPVMNEEEVIGEAIEALLAEPGPCEILVVDGGSRDRTAEIATSFPPPVRVIQQDRHGPRGRGAAYNQAARLASGEVLLFLHVDTRLPPDGIGLVQAALADPAVVGGGFLPTFGGAGGRWTGSLLGGIERVWRTRTRLRRWFAGDQAPFVRREAFMACGGYPVMVLAEDWAFAAGLRSLGRLVVIDRPVTVSARRHLANGVLKTLVVTGSVELMYRARVDPSFLAWWYHHWLPRSR